MRCFATWVQGWSLDGCATMRPPLVINVAPVLCWLPRSALLATHHQARVDSHWRVVPTCALPAVSVPPKRRTISHRSASCGQQSCLGICENGTLAKNTKLPALCLCPTETWWCTIARPTCLTSVICAVVRSQDNHACEIRMTEKCEAGM